MKLIVFLACFSGALAFQCFVCNNKPQDDDTQQCVERLEECTVGVNSCSSVLYTEKNGRVHERKFCTSPGSALFRYLMFFPGGSVCQNIDTRVLPLVQDDESFVTGDSLVAREQLVQDQTQDELLDRPVVRIVVDPVTQQRRELRNREPIFRVVVDPVTQETIEVVDREHPVREVISAKGQKHFVVGELPVIRQVVDPTTGVLRVLEDREPIVRVVTDPETVVQRHVIDREPVFPFVIDPVTNLRLRIVPTKPIIREITKPVTIVGQRVQVVEVIHPVLGIRLQVVVKRVIDTTTQLQTLIIDNTHKIEQIRCPRTQVLYIIQEGVVVGVVDQITSIVENVPVELSEVREVVDEVAQVRLVVVGRRTFIWESVDVQTGVKKVVLVREVFHPTQRVNQLVVVEIVRDVTTNVVRLVVSRVSTNFVVDPVLKQQFRVVDSVLVVRRDSSVLSEDVDQTILPTQFQNRLPQFDVRRQQLPTILNQQDVVPKRVQVTSPEDRLVDNVVLDKLTGIRHVPVDHFVRRPVSWEVVKPLNSAVRFVQVVEVVDPAVNIRRLVVVKKIPDTFVNANRLVVLNDDVTKIQVVREPVTGIEFRVVNGVVQGTEQFFDQDLPQFQTRKYVVPQLIQQNLRLPQVMAIDRVPVVALDNFVNTQVTRQMPVVFHNGVQVVSQLQNDAFQVPQTRENMLSQIVRQQQIVGPQSLNQVQWTGDFSDVRGQQIQVPGVFAPAPPTTFNTNLLCVCSSEKCNEGNTRNVVQQNLFKNVLSTNKVRGPEMYSKTFLQGKTIQ